MNRLKTTPILQLNTADTWRGGEKQTFLLTSLLHKMGYLSYCICKHNSQLHKKLSEEKLPHFSIKVSSAIDVFAARKISQIAKQVNAKILHMHTSHAHSLGYLSSYFYKAPVNIVSRRVDFRIHRNPFSRIKYDFPDKFAAVSGAIKDILISDGIEQGKISVIYSGIDLDSYNNIKTDYLLKEFPAISEKKVRLVNTAALTSQKDHETLLISVDILRKKFENFILLIAGEGQLKNKLVRLCKELKLENHVFFLGFREDALSLIKFADIFLMSSRWEGLGTSIIDAMALGKPVIATITGGIPELIQDNKNGLLVPKENPRAMAEAIFNLIKNKDLQKKISGNALISSRNFSIGKTVDKTIELYQELCESHLR
jgi:L-malate glycosyltransferase